MAQAVIGPGHALNLVGRMQKWLDQTRPAAPQIGLVPRAASVRVRARSDRSVAPDRDGFGGESLPPSHWHPARALHHGGRVRTSVVVCFLLRFRGDDRFGPPLSIGLVTCRKPSTRRQRDAANWLADGVRVRRSRAPRGSASIAAIDPAAAHPNRWRASSLQPLRTVMTMPRTTRSHSAPVTPDRTASETDYVRSATNCSIDDFPCKYSWSPEGGHQTQRRG